jgi:hypothetical protein
MDSARLGPYAFVLTPEELAIVRRRARHRWRMSGGPTLGRWPMILALLALVGVWLLLVTGGVLAPRPSQIALMFAVAAFFAGRWLHQWEVDRAFARADAQWSGRQRPEDRELSVAADDAIVSVDGRTHKTEIGWDNFTNVGEAAGLVWLEMVNFQSVVVAERAFADAQQRAAFLALARAKIKPDAA